MAIIVGTNEEMPQIIAALENLDTVWIWSSAALIALYLLLRSVTLAYALHIQAQRVSPLNAMIVTGVGQFYSAITPSASGGQPMQVMALHRMGVSIPQATAALSMKYLGFQTAFSVTGIFMWIFNANIVNSQLYGFRWLVVFGIGINALLVVLLLLISINVSLVERIVYAFIRFGKRLKLVKDENRALGKAMGYINDYRAALNNFKSHPYSAAMVLFLSFCQVIAYCSVLYCLYRAFSLTGASYNEITVLQVLLFLSASFMPLPGAAGAQEGGFYIFFKGIFPDASIIAAMLCWRFFTYYLLMISGLAGVVADKIITMRHCKREKR